MFKHPLNTPEGRHERAVWTFKDGEENGIPMALVSEFLKKKGLTDNEILSALNEASGGALVRSALGE